ncbi:hypothetical protein EDC96DRAFT_452795, partial [Choanephora cucurbitarum]
FLYEDAQGHIVDEHGFEPMDLVIGEEVFTIKTNNSHPQFSENKNRERNPNLIMHPVSVDKNNDADTELISNRRYSLLW